MTTKQRLPRLTKKRIEGLGILLAVISSIEDAGWEGTPYDANYETTDPDTEKLNAAVRWLEAFVRVKGG